jgi:hypothetical protein
MKRTSFLRANAAKPKTAISSQQSTSLEREEPLPFNSPVLELEEMEREVGQPGPGRSRQKSDCHRGNNLTCNSGRGNNRLRKNGHHENKCCDIHHDRRRESHPDRRRGTRCDRRRDIHSGSCRGSHYDKPPNYFQPSGWRDCYCYCFQLGQKQLTLLPRSSLRTKTIMPLLSQSQLLCQELTSFLTRKAASI